MDLELEDLGSKDPEHTGNHIIVSINNCLILCTMMVVPSSMTTVGILTPNLPTLSSKKDA